jgi:hypothetical protein
VYGRCGRPAEPRQALYELNKIGAHTRIDPAMFLFGYAGTGPKERCLLRLTRPTPALNRYCHSLAPTYDAVRNEPRFQDLLRRLGL